MQYKTVQQQMLEHVPVVVITMALSSETLHTAIKISHSLGPKY